MPLKRGRGSAPRPTTRLQRCPVLSHGASKSFSLAPKDAQASRRSLSQSTIKPIAHKTRPFARQRFRAYVSVTSDTAGRSSNSSTRIGAVLFLQWDASGTPAANPPRASSSPQLSSCQGAPCPCRWGRRLQAHPGTAARCAEPHAQPPAALDEPRYWYCRRCNVGKRLLLLHNDSPLGCAA